MVSSLNLEAFNVAALGGQIYSGTRSTLCPRQWNEVFSQDQFTRHLVGKLFKLKMPKEEKIREYLEDQPDWLHLATFVESSSTMAIPLRVELNVRVTVLENDLENDPDNESDNDSLDPYSALSLLILQTGTFLKRWCLQPQDPESSMILKYPSSVFPGILKDIIHVLFGQLLLIVEDSPESYSLGQVVLGHWLEKLIHYCLAGDYTRTPTRDWRAVGIVENIINVRMTSRVLRMAL